MYKAIDHYFQKENNPENIPDILLQKENEYMVKNIAVRYIKHPLYWIAMQNLNTNFKIWTINAHDLLIYCKYVIKKNNFNPYKDKMFIRRSKFKQPYDAKLFKEFSEYLDMKTKFKYSKKDKEFMYTTLLTDEEKVYLTPSLAKKASILKGGNKVKQIMAELHRKQDVEDLSISKDTDKTVIVFIDSDDNKNYSKLQPYFSKYRNKFKILYVGISQLETVLQSNKMSLIIGLNKNVLKELNPRLVDVPNRIFLGVNKVPVTGILRIDDNSISRIVDYLTKSNIAKAEINENSIDMSKSIKTLEPVKSWSELFDNYLTKGWKISTTQSFQHNDEFKNPLALISIYNSETNEMKYLNANKLDYVYYTYDNKDYETRGISPLEPRNILTKKTIKFDKYLTNSYSVYKGYSKPQLFEADIRAEDKLMNYAKEYANSINIDGNDIISVNPKVAYIDIEVYMDEGFEQTDTARKEINAIAYSVGDSTHVDIYVLDKTGKYTEEELNTSEKIKKMFDNAKQSVVDASKSKKGMEEVIKRIEKYTYSTKIVKTEHELLQCLENRIKEDKPQVLTSWNAWFDFNYIINRAKLMKYDDITMSPVGVRGYIRSDTGLYEPVGADVIDSLEAYAGSVRGALKSHKLNYIGNLELGLSKIDYDGELWQLYDRDLITFVGYNNFDVVIFKEIDIKKKILDQKMTYRQITGCSSRSIDSTIRSSDAVSIEYARKQDLAIRNHTRMINKEGQYIGAITVAKHPGVHYLVADLDQTSQYPSMMKTFNISPNTLIMKLDVPYEILYRYIHMNELSKEWAEKEIDIVVKPLVWYGGDSLGRHIKEKLISVLKLIKERNMILTLTGSVFENHTNTIGFFYTMLEDWKNKRDEYKRLMKQAHKDGNFVLKDIYNNLQLTMKILQNALYGATGTDSFRFFHIAIAAAITTQARTEISIVSKNLNQFILQWEDNIKQQKQSA